MADSQSVRAISRGPRQDPRQIEEQRRAAEHQAAFAELGPGFVAQPGMTLENLIPINRATRIAKTEGRLAGLGELAKYVSLGRGGVGDAAPWLRRMASRIARRPEQVDDLIQSANEAVLREGGTLDPRAAMRTAKTTMLNTVQEGGQGARSSVARAISKAQARIGENAGEFRLWSETNKNLNKRITLDQFRRARSGIKRQTVSLDQPLTAEGRTTMGDLLKGSDNPEAAAVLREGFRKLTPAQQQNLARRLSGENVNPAILKRIQDKLKGGAAKPTKPISGGSPGPEDAIPEYPANQFRVELKRQPRQMYGQEGPNVDPSLSRFSQDYNAQLTASGVWPDMNLTPGATTAPESGFHLLGAEPVLQGWDALRAIFNQMGKIQGRN